MADQQRIAAVGKYIEKYYVPFGRGEKAMGSLARAFFEPMADLQEEKKPEPDEMRVLPEEDRDGRLERTVFAVSEPPDANLDISDTTRVLSDDILDIPCAPPESPCTASEPPCSTLGEAMQPSAGAMRPSAGAMPPSVGAMRSSAGAMRPNAGAMPPSAGALRPCADAMRLCASAMPAGSRRLDDLLGQMDETFSEKLLRMIKERGMKDRDVYKKAYIDRRHFSKIRKNSDYVPNKKTVLAFSIALELTLDETKDLLRSAGYALSRSSKFDIIVVYFLEEKIYDMFEINDVLYAYEQPVFE